MSYCTLKTVIARVSRIAAYAITCEGKDDILLTALMCKRFALRAEMQQQKSH